MKSCCFTGHRDLPREAVNAIQGPLARQIEAFIAEGIVHFYAGGALGFDFLAEQAVLKAREQYPQIRLILALPYKGHDQVWKEEIRSNYQRLIEKNTDEILYISDHYFRGCMQKRNRYMVDHSDVCLSYLVYPKGGTKYTVTYCQKKGIPVMNLAQFIL